MGKRVEGKKIVLWYDQNKPKAIDRASSVLADMGAIVKYAMKNSSRVDKEFVRKSIADSREPIDYLLTDRVIGVSEGTSFRVNNTTVLVTPIRRAKKAIELLLASSTR